MKNKAMEAIGDTIGQSERDAIVAQLEDYANEINNIALQTPRPYRTCWTPL